MSRNSILSFTLADDERFYGGGSTSRDHIQHRGEVLRMWASYQIAEAPIPFMMSSAGWGVFDNTTVRSYFDVARYDKERLLIYNTAPGADFYVMVGGSMPQTLGLYTSLTGRAYVLPRWMYGLSFGGHMQENQFEMMDDAVRFRTEKVPCDVMWIEPQWMSKYYDFSTEKSWNYKLFPPEGYWVEKQFPKHEWKTSFVGRLHGLGYKLGLWLCIDHDQSIVEEDIIAAREGRPQSGKEHWFDHLTNFMDQGVDGFKLDPARTLDEHPDREYYNGFTDKEMHNLNQVLMPRQMNRVFRDHKGIRPWQHYCGGFAGTQRWTANQSGDNGRRAYRAVRPAEPRFERVDEHFLRRDVGQGRNGRAAHGRFPAVDPDQQLVRPAAPRGTSPTRRRRCTAIISSSDTTSFLISILRR